MKRAFVFSGGGSRGAYECGAWSALKELKIEPDAVYGTSIGAINAALVAQGDLQTAVDIWKNINMDRIAARDDGEEINIASMLSRKRDLLPFLVGNAKNLQLDIRPLEKLLDGSIDENKIRSSGIQLGMMLTAVNHLVGHPVRLNEIPRGELTEYLLASAACFPVFPIQRIDGHRYIDGGFVDNMPIGMAIEDGASEIIAVDIHPQPVHPEYASMPFLQLIYPVRELGNFLDFDPVVLDRSRRMGYYDTMKAYGILDGFRYTFRHINDLSVSDKARSYLQSVAVFDAKADLKKEGDTLLAALTSETRGKKLSWKDILIRGMEICASVLEFRDDAVYTLDDLTHLTLEYARSADLTGIQLREFDKITPRMRTAFIYQNARDDVSFITANLRKLSETPKESAAALYLLTMSDTVSEVKSDV